MEAELAKQREELSHAQLLKQEVIRDTAAAQEQLHGMISLLTIKSITKRLYNILMNINK